jgi:hypothetical protein
MGSIAELPTVFFFNHAIGKSGVIHQRNIKKSQLLMFFVGQRSQRSIAPVLVNPGVELQSALEKSQEELRQAAEGLGVDGVLRDPVIPYRYYLSLFKILKGSYRFFFF